MNGQKQEKLNEGIGLRSGGLNASKIKPDDVFAMDHSISWMIERAAIRRVRSPIHVVDFINTSFIGGFVGLAVMAYDGTVQFKTTEGFYRSS